MRLLFAVSCFALSVSCGAAPAPGAAEAPSDPGAPGTSPPRAGGPVQVVAIPPAASVDPAPEPPPPPAPPGDGEGGWPLFHGDPARTGRVDAHPITAPRILWRAEIGIQGWLNSPVVAGGLVIVPSSGSSHNMPDPRDGVFALDLRGGRVVWSAHFATDVNGVAASADRVIATSDEGTTSALDLRSGKVLWQQKGLGKVYSNPLILGDQVIVGDAGGVLRSYAVEGGAPRWTAQLDGAIRGGASSDGEQIYAVSQRGVAVALGLDGKVRWRAVVKAQGSTIEGYAAPVLTDRAVIIPFARDTYYDTPALAALSKKTGRTEWLATSAGGKDHWGNVRSTPALIDGALVFAEPYSGDVAAVDAASGRARYRRTIGQCYFPQYSSPAAAGGVVYVPRFDGTLSAIRADSGAVIWQMYLGDSRAAGGPPPSPTGRGPGCAWEVPAGAPLYATPAIARDGTILIGTAEGFLYAIGDGKER